MAENPQSVLFGSTAVRLGKIAPEVLDSTLPGWRELPEHTLYERVISAGLLSEDAAAEVQASLGVLHRTGAPTLQVEGEPAWTPLGAAPAWLNIQALRDGDAVQVPELPGRYKVIREYGRGGMGRVLLVHDNVLEREIALKELHTRQETDSMIGGLHPSPVSAPMVARFLQEARITGQLEHPGIVPVYELGRREDGTVYYTMKLVRGRTLSDSIRQAANLQERLELLPHFVNLCQAIAYAHSRGVVHRDLKPGNVMLGEFGETVVLDWGLAKPKEWDETEFGSAGLSGDGEEISGKIRLGSEGSSKKTLYGEALGTPAYMPPEQARGDLDKIDERSDVYSLGMVLFELLTGKLPYAGENLQAQLARAIVGDVPQVHALEPMAPVELAAICQRALNRDPDKRYQSAKELAEEVQRFLSGALVEAYSYSFRERLRRFAANYWLPLSILAVSIVVVAFIGTTAILRILEERNRAIREEEAALQAKQDAVAAHGDALAARDRAEASEARAEEAEHAARQGLYQSNLSLARQYLTTGDYSSARRALESAPPEYRGWEWGYLTAEAYPEWRERALFPAPSQATLRDFDVEPVTGKLACRHPHGITEMVDPITGMRDQSFAMNDLYDGSLGSSVWGQRLSPDGKSLCTFQPDDIFWFRGDSEEHTVMTSVETGGWRGAFSGDSRRFIVVSKLTRADVWEYGQARPVASLDVGYVYSAVLNRDGTLAAIASSNAPSVADTQCRLDVFRVDDGALLWSVPTASNAVLDAAIDADLLVTNSEESVISVYSFNETGGEIGRVEVPNKPTDVSLSQTGETIAVLCESGRVDWRRIGTPSEAFTFDKPGEPASSIALSPDGSMLAIGTVKRRSYLLDAFTGREMNRFPGHDKSVERVAFLMPQHLLLTSDGQTLRFWRWDTQPPNRILPIEIAEAVPLDEGKVAVLTTTSEFLSENPFNLHPEAGKPILIEMPEHARISGNGRRVIEFTTNGALVHDLKNDSMTTIAAGHDLRFAPVDVSDDGGLLALAVPSRNDESELTVYDIDAYVSGRQSPLLRLRFYFPILQRMYGPGGIALCPDGRSILITMMDSLSVYDLESQRMMAAFEVPDTADALRLAQGFSHDGRFYVYANSTGGATIVDWQKETVLASTLASSSACTALAFSPDDQRLFAGYADGSIRIWNPGTGTEVLPLQRLESGVKGLLPCPDGLTLLAWSSSSEARLFRAIDWERLPMGESTPLSERMGLFYRYLPELRPPGTEVDALLYAVEEAKGYLATDTQAGVDVIADYSNLAPYLDAETIESARAAGIVPGRLGELASSPKGRLLDLDIAEAWAASLEEAIASGDAANEQRLAALLKLAGEGPDTRTLSKRLIERPEPCWNAALISGRAAYERYDSALHAITLGRIERHLGLLDDAVLHMAAAYHERPTDYAEYAWVLAERGEPGDVREAWRVLRKEVEDFKSLAAVPQVLRRLESLPTPADAADDRDRVLAIVEAPASGWMNYPYQTDLASAMETARADGRLVLAEFSVEGSHLTQEMLENVLSRPEIQEKLGQHYVWVRLDGPASDELTTRYRVNQFPTFIALNVAGEELERMESSKSADNFNHAFLHEFSIAPCVMDWMVREPEPINTLAVDTVLQEISDGMVQHPAWHAARSTSLHGEIDLNKCFVETSQSDLWMAARVEALEDVSCRFDVSFDDYGAVYLDGKSVFEHTTPGGAMDHAHTLNLDLGAGIHTLVLRVTNVVDRAAAKLRVGKNLESADTIRILPVPEDMARLERQSDTASTDVDDVAMATRGAERVPISKNTLLTAWRDEWQRSGIGIISRAGIEVVFDENGAPMGIRGNNFSEVPVCTMLKMRDGDVILSINGQKLSKGLDFSSYETTFSEMSEARLPTWYVDLLRDGEPMRIEFEIQY
ncbi:MAG: protein kinase [Candidatus Hydrogenedens sp.]|nr:protein kinase [Candidatus Hydrogenedens sp.]